MRHEFHGRRVRRTLCAYSQENHQVGELSHGFESHSTQSRIEQPLFCPEPLADSVDRVVDISADSDLVDSEAPPQGDKYRQKLRNRVHMMVRIEMARLQTETDQAFYLRRPLFEDRFPE